MFDKPTTQQINHYRKYCKKIYLMLIYKEFRESKQ